MNNLTQSGGDMEKIRLLLRSVYLKGHQDALSKGADMSWEDKIIADIKQCFVASISKKKEKIIIGQIWKN